MKQISLATLLIINPVYCAAHDPIDATATVLDEHLEIVIHHPSDDPNHYVNHVTVKRGGRIILDQDFDAQTDTLSLDIPITHPVSQRRRIKKGALIMVHATCNQEGELNKEIRVH